MSVGVRGGRGWEGGRGGCRMRREKQVQWRTRGGNRGWDRKEGGKEEERSGG